MESVGETLWDPFGCTAPIPSMETSVALLVCQVSEADWPAWIVFGFTEIEAVGAGAGGGAGGGGGAAFLPHAPRVISAASARTNKNHFELNCFTFPPSDSDFSESDEVDRVWIQFIISNSN